MKCTIDLPFFPGYYNSLLWNSDSEYEAIRQELEYYRDEEGRTDLTANDLELDWDRYENAVNLEFCRIWQQYAPKFIASVEFKELWSPREYNFETDRIVAEIEMTDGWAEAMDAFIRENYEELEERIRRDWSSCDGFWSWTSNDIREWPWYLFTDKNGLYISEMIRYMMEMEWESSGWGESIEDSIVQDVLERVYYNEYITLAKDGQGNQ